MKAALQIVGHYPERRYTGDLPTARSTTGTCCGPGAFRAGKIVEGSRLVVAVRVPNVAIAASSAKSRFAAAIGYS